MELCDKFWVERWQFCFRVFEGVSWRMLAQPQLHKCKENAIVIEIGRVEHLCFSLPLSTKFSCYFFNEGSEFIEFLLWIVTVEEIKV
jgi:hypothetical protein